MADVERGGAPVGAEQARRLTRQIRVAIADVRQAGMVLADRVRRAHQGRVWVALGYRSWAEYATAELGVSRAQAYRLVDMATTADELTAVAAGLRLSPVGDVGLSGRALREVRGRVAEVAAVLADRVAELRAGGRELTEPQAAALIEQAVAEVRRRPALPPPARPPARARCRKTGEHGQGDADDAHRAPCRHREAGAERAAARYAIGYLIGRPERGQQDRRSDV